MRMTSGYLRKHVHSYVDECMSLLAKSVALSIELCDRGSSRAFVMLWQIQLANIYVKYDTCT